MVSEDVEACCVSEDVQHVTVLNACICGLSLTKTSLCGAYLYTNNSFVNGEGSSDSIADAGMGDSNCCTINT